MGEWVAVAFFVVVIILLPYWFRSNVGFWRDPLLKNAAQREKAVRIQEAKKWVLSLSDKKLLEAYDTPQRWSDEKVAAINGEVARRGLSVAK